MKRFNSVRVVRVHALRVARAYRLERDVTEYLPPFRADHFRGTVALRLIGVAVVLDDPAISAVRAEREVNSLGIGINPPLEICGMMPARSARCRLLGGGRFDSANRPGTGGL